MNTRAESIDGDAVAVHATEGGSIPASALFFHPASPDEVWPLVKRYHYSRRMPSANQVLGSLWTGGGLFGTKGDMVAACIMGMPATRWSESVIELTRLVRTDSRVPLSMLVGLTVRLAKRITGHDLAVSFADSTQGHEGYVYQASSWHYHGKRDRAMDGLIIDGQFTPGRTCNALYDTRSPDGVRAILGPRHTVEPHYDEGKHLYWKPIRRSGQRKAERLGLERNPYPKGDLR